MEHIAVFFFLPVCGCAACDGAWSPGGQRTMGGEWWERHCSHGTRSDLRWHHPHAHRPLQVQGTLPAWIQTCPLLRPPDQAAVSLLVIFDRGSSLILWRQNLPGYKPAPYSDPLTKLPWVSSLIEVPVCDSLTAKPACEWLLREETTLPFKFLFLWALVELHQLSLSFISTCWASSALVELHENLLSFISTCWVPHLRLSPKYIAVATIVLCPASIVMHSVSD